MALAPGTALGPYVIEDSIGSGGMGEVYRAKDARLDRSVAVKILPSHLSDDREFLQRFEREAKALAGLSHPNISTLYDVGYVDGIRFLVMELLEGETLAARLAREPLSEKDALAIAQQLCGALERAHRHGIVHRDLKPANIMLTKGGAKLLDFGLARPLLPSTLDSSADAETAPLELTRQDAIVGTLHYMSPEQVKGESADHRSDVFALGAVLYEMLSGQKAFRGESQAEVMASILSHQPDLADSTPALRRALARCLAKDPEARWQSPQDLQYELDWIAAGGDASAVSIDERRAGGWRLYSGWIAVLIVVLASVLLMSRSPRPQVLETTPARLSLTLPDGASGAQAAISPDGRWIALNTSTDGQRNLWLRALDSSEARRLDRTEGARSPFWSPDGQSLAFFANAKLKTIPVSGGPTRTICDAPGPFTLGTWGSNGTILFSVLEAPGQNGIHRVSETGGKSELLALSDAAGLEPDLAAWPHFLPNGDDFLLFCGFGVEGAEERGGLCIASLSTGRIELLIPSTTKGARAEFSRTGHLLYTRDQVLLAQHFDPDRRRLSGVPFELADRIDANGPMGFDSFSVSHNGVLVYEEQGGRGQLVWKDRNGRTTGLIGEPGYIRDLSLSPDERRLAVSAIDPRINLGNIWIHDLERDVATRFTSGLYDDVAALWSPDGERIVFSAAAGAPPFLHQKALDGGAAEALVPSRGMLQGPLCWTSRGSELLFMERSADAGWDLWVLAQEPGAQATPFLQTPASESFADLSPDDQWLAYTSDESGQNEIYVRPYRRSGSKQRISRNGGWAPRWRGDGAELFYVDSSGMLCVVSMAVDSKGRLAASQPQPLFSVADSPTEINPYAVTSDGQRFVTAEPADAASGLPYVIVNWTALMPAAGPGG